MERLAQAGAVPVNICDVEIGNAEIQGTPYDLVYCPLTGSDHSGAPEGTCPDPELGYDETGPADGAVTGGHVVHVINSMRMSSFVSYIDRLYRFLYEGHHTPARPRGARRIAAGQARGPTNRPSLTAAAAWAGPRRAGVSKWTGPIRAGTCQ